MLLPAHDYVQLPACTVATESDRQPLLAAALAGQLTDAEFSSAKAALEINMSETAFHILSCGARIDGACAQPAVTAGLTARRPAQRPGGNTGPT